MDPLKLVYICSGGRLHRGMDLPPFLESDVSGSLNHDWQDMSPIDLMVSWFDIGICRSLIGADVNVLSLFLSVTWWYSRIHFPYDKRFR